MVSSMQTLIFAPIAERDVHFYLAAAHRLASRPELKIVFVSFYEPGNSWIERAGFEVFNPYKTLMSAGEKNLEPEAYAQKFGIGSIRALGLHETLTFGKSDPNEVDLKFCRYLQACDQLLSQIEEKYPSSSKVIIQELAGFVGPLSLFFAGMKRGWANEFLEPSFFKGRIHFLKNNLFLNIPRNSAANSAAVSSVAQYLEKALSSKLVVAATKDSHHYKDMGLGKIFNSYNFEKITKKIFYKYVLGKKQEFDQILNHSLRSLRMLANRTKNGRAYAHLNDLSNLPPGSKIVYFPFHVQLDFALTIRCPEWLDQLRLVENVLENLPANTVLVAKEHPASIGCLDQTRLEKVLANPKFKLMHPQINSHDILEKCCGAITINSKVGAEALSKGFPVISFGKAFYTQQGFTTEFTSWSQLKQDIGNWPAIRISTDAPKPWLAFLAQVWENSFPSELYDLSDAQVQDFSSACATILQSNL